LFKLGEQQVALLEAAVAFANMTVEGTRAVEALFENLPGVGAFQTMPAALFAQYRDVDQEELRSWLHAIDDGRGDKIAKAVSERLADTMPATVWFDARRGEVSLAFRISGVQAATALAAALLLSRSGRLRGRLNFCDAPIHGKRGWFHLDLKPGQGRPWKYCNPEHRRQADIAHTMAARERKGKRKNRRARR
jgi:hypothetical protein